MKKNVLVQSLIDVEKWNNAKWSAVVFASDEEKKFPPFLGIAFQNGEIGKQIFVEWIERFGGIDKLEELRISIIEGDIPEQEYGYSVHINSNPANMELGSSELGISSSEILFMSVGRIHRMNPAPDSPNLSNFKQDYSKHNKYKLIPVGVKNGSYEPYFDYSIEKSEIHFRNVSEIAEDDIDCVIFKSNSE